jgi:hypothetical protein
MDTFESQNEVKVYSELNLSVLRFHLEEKHEILFTNLPKMNLIEYFCSVGGLISMWFGFSVYDLVLIFTKESKKKVLLLLVSMNCQIFITVIVKFKQIISKLNDIFSSITIIVFSVLMFIQVTELISSYFDYEVVTRFDVQQIKLIPNVMLIFEPLPNNLNEIYEIYPQMKQEIDDIEKSQSHSEALKHFSVAKIYEQYLVQLLIDNRFDDIQRISQTNNIIVRCQISIFDEIESKNCTQGELEIWNVNLKSILMIKRFDFSKLKDKSKVEKITFQLKSVETVIAAIFYLTYTQPIPKSEVLLSSNTKTTTSFSTFLTKKLRINEINCISEEYQKDFSDDYFDFCLYDCNVDKAVQLCGCVPFYDVEFYFRKKFLKNNYKFCKNCSHSFDNQTFSLIRKQCQKICKPKCNSLNFDTKIQVSEQFSNKTILEIFANKSPRIVYIETLKTNFDQLIYNCGAILGLWFGLSPIKATDLIQYIPKIYRISINLCATVYQFLIAFCLRIKQK